MGLQELRLLRSRREELEYELEKHRRLVTHESMDKDSATLELSTLKANVRELHFVVEQQNSALQAKQEELALQRERLLKIQSEAEVNERRVRELDTKLRMSEDANKVRVLPFAFDMQNVGDQVKTFTLLLLLLLQLTTDVLAHRPCSCRSARTIRVLNSLLQRRNSSGPP